MNSSDNITVTVSVDTFHAFTRGLYTYGIPVICIFGFLGNMLSFKVFVFSSFKKHSSSIYTAALSMSDTGFLASLFLSWLGGGRIGVTYGSNPVWCHVMIYVTYLCSFLSVWYVVLIMLDRYIVVCHSLSVPQLCTKRRTRLAIAAVTLSGVFIYAHTFFTTKVTGDNCSAQFLMRFLSIFIYIDTAITFIIPFALIIVLNILVITSLKRFQTLHIVLSDRPPESAQSSVLSQAQLHITRTLVLVSLVMLITNVPSHGIRFYGIVNDLLQDGNEVLLHAQHVCTIIYYFNFAVNFLLYSVSSDKFRKYHSFKYLFRRCNKRRRGRNTEHLYR